MFMMVVGGVIRKFVGEREKGEKGTGGKKGGKEREGEGERGGERGGRVWENVLIPHSIKCSTVAIVTYLSHDKSHDISVQ